MRIPAIVACILALALSAGADARTPRSVYQDIAWLRSHVNDKRRAKCRKPHRVRYANVRNIRHPKLGRALWRRRHARVHRLSSRCLSWRTRNILAAEYVARHGSGDPWPNCPNPPGASWDATKACESRGYGWGVDPPGWYCGPLQLDPVVWRVPIRRYGLDGLGGSCR